jgi:arsenate reductase
MKNVMFVCQDNTYSQIAAAWMRHLAKETVSVTSTGLHVGQSGSPFAQAMDEVGIVLNGQNPKLLNDYHPQNFDAVISLGHGSMRLPDEWMLRQVFDEWILPHLEVESLESLRQVRDDIRDRIDVLLMRYSI